MSEYYSAEYTGKAVIRQILTIAARIDRDVEREDNKSNGDFLDPEWEDLRHLSGELKSLADKYLHLAPIE